MLCRVSLEIGPKFVGKRIFCINATNIAANKWIFNFFRPVFGVENRFECRTVLWIRKREAVNVKSGIFAESNNENTFTMLRHEAFAVYNPT